MRSPLLLAFMLLAIASLSAQRNGPVPAPSGGDHLLYIGTYTKEIQIFDEATEQRVGEIKLVTGIPRTLILSHSRSKFYVLDATFEKVEVVDIPSRRSITSFTLSAANQHARIRRRGGLQVDPLERFLVLAVGTATKLRDRWDIGDVVLQVYDLTQKKITREIPWPGGEPRENMTIRFSPDGKFLYFFGDEVVILETENFTTVDTWALSRPIEQGLGRMTVGAVDAINDEPGYFTGVFTVEDPLHHRRVMGLGRVNLVAKSFEFSPIGPPADLSFSLAPDRKRGYGLLQQIGHYEFWLFDLERKELVSRTQFEGRPRMSLRVSSNGKLLYIFQAGATIDVYEAATYRYLRTIEMNADQTTDLFILPKSTSPSQN